MQILQLLPKKWKRGYNLIPVELSLVPLQELQKEKGEAEIIAKNT